MHTYTHTHIYLYVHKHTQGGLGGGNLVVENLDTLGAVFQVVEPVYAYIDSWKLYMYI